MRGSPQGETEARGGARCRICHGLDGHLLRVCGCRGTCGSVHATCIQQWIAHRHASGMRLPDAMCCEVCLRRFTHRLERQSVVRFLLSRRAWRIWAHLAYLALDGRRVCSPMSSFARSFLPNPTTSSTATSAAASCSYPRTWISLRALCAPVTWFFRAEPDTHLHRARIIALICLQYWTLFLFDARCLLSAYRRWRASTTKIIICDNKHLDDQVSSCHPSSDHNYTTGNGND